MAWTWYWVESSDPQEPYGIYYDARSNPARSVKETWLDVGVTCGSYILYFSEYRYSDNDPDGVREAYGECYEDEYTFEVHTSRAKPEKFFVYTLMNDGRVHIGLDISLKEARACYVFTKPHDLTDDTIIAMTEGAEAAAYNSDVKATIQQMALGGDTQEVFMAVLKNR